MKLRSIATVLLLVVAAGAGDPREELEYASRLGVRGLDDMALKILDDLERSADPVAARYGRYGKALLTKQQASVARFRFLQDLESGRKLRVPRAEVLKLYEDAKPKIEEYVKTRADDLDARFLLAELLQEYAEFLTAADYPESMAEEKEKFLSEHKSDADGLFQEAIRHYGDVATLLAKSLGDDPDPADPKYIRATNAAYNKARARLRWALMYPKGPNFQHRSGTASEELDAFLSEHFEDIFGAYAMLDLGECYLERGLRMGEDDDAQVAADYFHTLYTTVVEDPTVKDTSTVLAKAFWFYAKTCNAIASKAGNLKKARPIFYENTIRSGTEMPQRLKYGVKLPFALRAQLLVAEAYAARSRFDDAVSLAGEVLSDARLEGHGTVAKEATAKLTDWVANVKGAGALDPGLLFQIGDSLLAQGRSANAITFFEKAISAATTEDDRDRWGHPARLRIASAYRADKRYFIAGAVAWAIVEDYLKSGEDEESAFGQVASDACNVARLSWKTISELTGRSSDKVEYDKVTATFRSKFPSHPENADAEFSRAKEIYDRGEFEEAAKLFTGISSSSPNYWRAQRMVPLCFRRLASDEKSDAKAKGWHERTLAAAQQLMALAKAKPSDQGAQRAVQYGHLFELMALGALQRWPEAQKSVDSYLAAYPGVYLKRGLELKIKIDSHIAQGQLDEAERTLATLRKKLPGSSYVRGSIYDVYAALREKYKGMGTASAERAGLASRAADLFEAWVGEESKPDYKLLFLLGDALADAKRWREAGEAFANSAELVRDPKAKSAYKLKAATMQYKAAKEGLAKRSITRSEYIKILKTTRELYTDVLIPDKDDQTKLLRTLANYAKWPSKDEWKKIKRNPEALITAAEIFPESAPAGLNGLWIAVRLLKHLHSFTRAVSDPGQPERDKYIPYWWDGAQLMLETQLKIAQSGDGPAEKKAAQNGHAFAKKIIFQYSQMDGPERVQKIKELEALLKVQAR